MLKTTLQYKEQNRKRKENSSVEMKYKKFRTWQINIVTNKSKNRVTKILLCLSFQPSARNKSIQLVCICLANAFRLFDLLRLYFHLFKTSFDVIYGYFIANWSWKGSRNILNNSMACGVYLSSLPIHQRNKTIINIYLFITILYIVPLVRKKNLFSNVISQ